MKKALGLFLLFVINLFSQAVNINKIIEKDSVTIGERINVTFKVNAEEKHYDVVKWEDKFSADVEVKNKKLKKSQEGDFFNYVIACYDTGWVSIAPFQIALTQGGKDSASVYYGTDSIRIFVKSLVPDSASKIVSIKDPVSYPFPWFKWLSVLFGVIILIIIVIIIYKKLYRREEILEDFKIPQRPAHEIAFEKLNKLDPEKIYTPEEAKKFHFNLSYIFREYLENRYHKNYLEKTTFEIKPILKRDIVNNDLYHQVIKILNASDEVKFAKRELEKMHHKDIYNKTTEIIQETMVKPEVY